MELVDYPQALAVASREFLVLDQQVKQLKKEIEQIQWDTFSLVSFDPTLKNQNQRDCRKREVLNSNSEYLDLLSKFEKVCQ